MSEKPIRVGDLIKAKEITRNQVLAAVATIFDGRTTVPASDGYAPGKNAGVLVPAPGVMTGAFEGAATLTDEQARALTAGQTYFNIHTAAHPNGEVRGQVTK